MHDTLEVILPSIFAICGIGLGWWINSMRHRPERAPMPRRSREDELRLSGLLHGVGPGDDDADIMCRPMEFGPLMQPREVIDRIRDAIVEDQLGARKESPKQRRQRMTRLAGFTDRQRVQHWLLHWREDYMADLTGRSWAPA